MKKIEKYHICYDEEIGGGCFGKVYKCYLDANKSSEAFACKVIDLKYS